MKMNRVFEPMNAVINDLSREERLKQPDVVVKDDGAKDDVVEKHPVRL